jgi:hypothetical protein
METRLWVRSRYTYSAQIKDESGTLYAYQEPLGKVVRNGGYFLASKD